ncbi:MAG: RnfH family protein [Alphaproteobacteria bacterium]|nr:RnfH family protein [Alphaproteobacteria bacterium]MDD9920384.1 RnfH family protein [Alphaproteobacteria bacterium]
MNRQNRLTATVCYADTLKSVTVPHGATLERAILASGILGYCPDIDLAKNKVGVYARIQPLHILVEQGDRIEIYRPVNPEAAQAARQRRKKESK